MSPTPLPAVAAPHAHDQSSVSRIMLHVCLALVPCTVYGFYLFGWPAIILFVLTVGSAIAWEALCFWLLKTPQLKLLDGSAMLTGWLLALSLPPWAPWWIGVGGSFVAIVVGKQIFGGLGYNLFNPAMLARVALLISFPVQMTTWIIPSTVSLHPGLWDSLTVTAGIADGIDAYTGPTILSHIKTQLSVDVSVTQTLSESYQLSSSLFGNSAGSLGETSALLIVAGGVYLLILRIISWHIPAAMLLTTALLATVFNLWDAARYAPASVHLLSGGMMLGAFFIATDLVTSPATKFGQLLFGCGCGLLAFVIRTWGNFPEGVGFAVLFMNALTPLIDLYFKPRVYGRGLDGSPRQAAKLTTQDTKAR